MCVSWSFHSISSRILHKPLFFLSIPHKRTVLPSMMPHFLGHSLFFLVMHFPPLFPPHFCHLIPRSFASLQNLKNDRFSTQRLWTKWLSSMVGGWGSERFVELYKTISALNALMKAQVRSLAGHVSSTKANRSSNTASDPENLENHRNGAKTLAAKELPTLLASVPLKRSLVNPKKRKREEPSVKQALEEAECRDGGNKRVTQGMVDLNLVQASEWKSKIGGATMLLGTGSFSQVVAAQLKGEIVAAKIFKGTSTSDFLREVTLMARLQHPAIVSYRGYFQSKVRQVLFTEKMLMSVQAAFAGCKKIETKWPLNVRIRWCLQLTRAVEYLHSIGYVHRDINTKNVLLTDATEARLCDFTFMMPFMTKAAAVLVPNKVRAAQLEFESLALPQHVGTLRYMAPEIAQKKAGIIDFEAADMWSLGQTLLEILTGCKPYEQKAVVPIEHVIKITWEKAAERSCDGLPTVTKAKTTKHNMPEAQITAFKTLTAQVKKCMHIVPARRPSAFCLAKCLLRCDESFRSTNFTCSKSSPRLAEAELNTFPPAEDTVAPSPKKVSR